jgi:hypothetical protein
MIHICTRILRRKAAGNAIRARRGQDRTGQDDSAAGASQEVPKDIQPLWQLFFHCCTLAATSITRGHGCNNTRREKMALDNRVAPLCRDIDSFGPWNTVLDSARAHR